MKQQLGLMKRVLLLFTPLVASSMLATSPSQAATFAFSQGVVNFTNFSQNPSTISTEVEANAVTIANGGTVTALANAEAIFLVAPTEASNSSLAVALGENRNYLGLAESQTRVIGGFDVDADTIFSFDFTATLNLETSIDNPQVENARASGDTSLWLLDTANQTVLDFFSLIGNLNTPGDIDWLAFQKSENLRLSNTDTTSNFGGNQESLTASVQGSLQRSFANTTNLTLVEVTRTRAIVTAPEPSTNLALLFSCGVIGVALKGRRKATKSRSLVETKVTAEV